MNEIETYQAQLPDALEDLSQFVLVNEERVQALRAQIRAIKKVNLAKEVYEQKLAEAQEIGQITVEAAQKMGELLLQIQKASGGINQYNKEEKSTITEKSKTKAEVISEIGIERHAANDYQQMAQNPEAVQAAIQKAIENGDVVSRNQVMKEIRSAKEELKRQLAEKDKTISELKNQKPEVKEIHVVPDDYESIKKGYIAYKNEAEMAWKEQRKAAKSLLELKQKMRDLEEREGKDSLEAKVKKESEFFAIRVYKFIQDVGGSVWIPQYMDELSDQDRKNFIDAIYTLDAFSKQMIENIGGYGIE